MFGDEVSDIAIGSGLGALNPDPRRASGYRYLLPAVTTTPADVAHPGYAPTLSCPPANSIPVCPQCATKVQALLAALVWRPLTLLQKTPPKGKGEEKGGREGTCVKPFRLKVVL